MQRLARRPRPRSAACPAPGRLLAETFPRGALQHLCLYGFAGRNAHQTLGLLVTRRMETAGLNPLGFVANDYALLIWGLDPVARPRGAARRPRACATASRAGSAANAVMKRTFRNVATVAGLIEKNLPGLRKTGRQATFSSDILYDTLRRHDPGHLMLRITRAGGRPRPRRLRPHRGDAGPQPRPHRRRPRPARHPARRAAASSRSAASRSAAAPRPASSPRPRDALLAEAGLT